MQVGLEEGVPVLNVWDMFKARPDWRELLSDGVHFAPGGDELVFEGLKEMILKEFPAMEPERLPLDLPMHDDFAEGCCPQDVLGPYL